MDLFQDLSGQELLALIIDFILCSEDSNPSPQHEVSKIKLV